MRFKHFLQDEVAIANLNQNKITESHAAHVRDNYFGLFDKKGNEELRNHALNREKQDKVANQTNKIQNVSLNSTPKSTISPKQNDSSSDKALPSSQSSIQNKTNAKNNSSLKTENNKTPAPLVGANTTNLTKGPQVDPKNKNGTSNHNYTLSTNQSSTLSPNQNSTLSPNQSSTLSPNQARSNSVHIPWGLVIGIIAILAAILIIAYVLYTLWKRYLVRKKYNQTPEHFAQNPTLSLHQKASLLSNKFQPFKKYQKDIQVEELSSYGGKNYKLSFSNQANPKYSSAYWTKQMRTDSYFQVEICSLNSLVQFGFVHKKHFEVFEKGIQNSIGQLGVSVNSSGLVQLLGQVKYKHKQDLQYGDVIGIGISKIQDSIRVWITQNGILLNPPTQDQIEQWLSKQKLQTQHKDAYNSLVNSNKFKNLNKKGDIQLAKKKLTLPNTQEFEYYAMIGSWQLSNNVNSKTDSFSMKRSVSTVNVNVGGKVFRLRDDNLKSGLLADASEKDSLCSCLPCF